MQKRWILPETRELATGASLTAFFGESPIHPVAARLLASRGIESEADVAAFLNPNWDTHVHDPFLFSHMEEAVQRVFAALTNGEHITVHGDYDADGVTGSAVLIETLKELRDKSGSTAIVDWYIPHRDKEGYGLNPTSVKALSERGTNVIITVDCGIANVAEIAQARELGMDVIVVDHHQFGEELPNGILIHPRLPGEQYPFPWLAAVGVSWKLACALCVEARRRGLDIPDGFEKWLLDFVSIATVTDMVPMVGENRVLETYGLKVLNKTKRPGLQTLIKLTGYVQGKLTTESVAFGLGPRINAAGRMDHAEVALRLMLAETDEEAAEIGEAIETLNKERQKAVARIMKEAETQFADSPEGSVLAFWSESWPPALVGLVAGKFLDKTGRPTIAIGKNGDRWVGSGRSFAAYDITEGIKRAGEGILNHSGGHVQACGFSFNGEDPRQLVEKFYEDAACELKDIDCSPTLRIDAELGLEELDWSLLETLDRLEPFGETFKRPQFMSSRLSVASANLVGQTQKHVSCVLRSPSGRNAKFIGFNMSDKFDLLGIGKSVDVVYDVGLNEWNGRKEIQCKLIDVRMTN